MLKANRKVVRVFPFLLINLILVNTLEATTKYEGTWKGWLTSDTTLECGFSRSDASMTVNGTQFVIKTEDASGNRLVIGSINENKVKQFAPFTIVNEFDNEENLAKFEGFFGNSSFYGNIIVEALTPKALCYLVRYIALPYILTSCKNGDTGCDLSFKTPKLLFFFT